MLGYEIHLPEASAKADKKNKAAKSDPSAAKSNLSSKAINAAKSALVARAETLGRLVTPEEYDQLAFASASRASR